MKLQLFVLAVEKLCIKSSVISPAVTECTRMFFLKKEQSKSNARCKKSSQISVLGKSSSKTSNKNLRSKPVYNSCKEHYFSFLHNWISISFLHKCKNCWHCRNNGLIVIRIKISIIINKSLFNKNKVSTCPLVFSREPPSRSGASFSIFLIHCSTLASSHFYDVLTIPTLNKFINKQIYN